MISLVIPCYNEEHHISALYKATMDILNQLSISDYEFIFVDDGSSDRTLAEIKQLCLLDSNVAYLSFSRNFGKEAAMLAGMEYASGELVAIMDADMQDPPALLEPMYEMLKNNKELDCIGTRRVTRKGEPKIRSFCARQFYKLINRMSSIEIVDGARDFRLMRRNMVNAIISLPEKNRFSKGLFVWVGFKTKYIEYENIERSSGQSKWSFWDLALYSLDGILSFSTVPLAIVSIIGVLFFLLSMFLLGLVFAQKIIWGNPIQGWTSMMCIILMLFGVQLFSTGIIGQYIMKVFVETKKRPLYVLRETHINNRLTESQGRRHNEK